MKLKHIISAVAVFALLPFTGHAQDQLKVITFNVLSFEETNFDIEPFVTLLKSEQPDVVCLNEVENRSSRQQQNGEYRDMVQLYADKLNMFGLFGYSYNLTNKKGDNPEENYKYSFNELYGNAIMSKYPILNVTTKQLPRPEGSADQRGVVTADILLPSGKIVRVAATHLDHIGGQLEQAEVLISDAVVSKEYPTILCGDMNRMPGSDVINRLLTVYERLDTEDGSFAGAHIDYILGTKGKFEMQSSKVLSNYLNGKMLSDHSPLLSVIKLK